MMKRTGQVTEYAQHLIEMARLKPAKLLDSYSPSSKSKSIHQKLLEVYIEESSKETSCKKLKRCSNLLDKLVRKEHLNTLIVNLYPGNEGYSLMLRGRNGADSETIKLPYEESDLLEYLDVEELPPILVDLLDKSQANIFYSGCVITEVRDYRRSTDGSYDTQYILLKPTPHSLLCDINSITNDGHRWTQEDRYNLESQLLTATQEPLCLDPSPAALVANNILQFDKLKLSAPQLKKSIKKFTQAAVNRKRKFAQCAAPLHLQLHDFVEKKKEKQKVPPLTLKNVDMWKQREHILTEPESIDVKKYAQPLERLKSTLDNTPVTVEEYILETDRSQSKASYTKLTVQQRMTDEFYLGQLYVDRNFTEGQQNGSVCKFPLGTKRNAERYIRQFTEIFTEEGRRQVKITHLVAGKEPVVRYTQQPPVSSSADVHIAVTTQPTPAVLSEQVPTSTVKKSQLKLSLSLGGQSGSLSTLRSPAQSPTETQLPTYSQATGMLSPPSGKLHLASTPPPGPQSIKSSFRRGSLSDAPSAAAQLTRMSQSIQLAASQVGSHSAPATPDTALPPPGVVRDVLNTTSSSTGTHNTNIITSAVNLTSLGGIPPNINVQNLSGLQTMGLSGLQNLPNAPTGIAVPMPLNMLSSSTGATATPAGIFVTSVPTGFTISSSTSSETQNSDAGFQPSLVTKVTTISPNVSGVSTSSASTSSSTGLLAAANTVLTSVNAGGMVQLPIGLPGNITQLMGLKGAHGLRPGAPLSLVQIQGQQNAPLLLGIPRPAQPPNQVLQSPPPSQNVKHERQSPVSVSVSKTSIGTTQLTQLPTQAASTQQSSVQQITYQQSRSLHSKGSSKKRKHKSS